MIKSLVNGGFIMRILTIEDDPKILDVLDSSLTKSGFMVDMATSGEDGLNKITNSDYDAIVLDLMLPGIDGIEVLKEIRKLKQNTPVLILSAKQALEDKISGLKLGADDYMVKPFAVSELEVRLLALMRRSKGISNENLKVLSFNDLKMDLESREVTRGSLKLPLQVKEFALLELLMRNPGKVLTKPFILEKIWGYDFDPQTNVVDVLVCRLRNKVDKDFSQHLIQTHRGVGYVLKAGE